MCRTAAREMELPVGTWRNRLEFALRGRRDDDRERRFRERVRRTLVRAAQTFEAIGAQFHYVASERAPALRDDACQRPFERRARQQDAFGNPALRRVLRHHAVRHGDGLAARIGIEMRRDAG